MLEVAIQNQYSWSLVVVACQEVGSNVVAYKAVIIGERNLDLEHSFGM